MPRVPIVQLRIMLSIELFLRVLFISVEVHLTMGTLVIGIVL